MTIRRGLTISADGRAVGVVVHDERAHCSGAACRFCGGAVYDSESPTAARWLTAHLHEEHGLRGALGIEDGRSETAIVRQVRAALRTPPGRRSAA